MNHIVLEHDSIVYVLCPAYYKTGGTELLHQYVCVAKKHGIDCRIVYPNIMDGKAINPSFETYVDKFFSLSDVQDINKNVIIIPEIYTQYVKQFKNLRKIIWWESVDNYLLYSSIKFNLKKLRDGFLSSLKRIVKIILHFYKCVPMRAIREKVDYHFVQSFYAKDFLIKNDIVDNVFYVSDYINDVYTSFGRSICLDQKENIVCYNPAKGKKYTSKIVKKSKGIKFVPLVNMTNNEVMNTLSRAKVYIDFGNHPGKDRFPREAAAMYCCIITSKDGAAGFFEDVRINSEFKFNKKDKNISSIINSINKCLTNYEAEIQKFDSYRNMIFGEKEAFEENLINCYKINN